MSNETPIERATASVLQVGDGRGFLVEVANQYFDYPEKLIMTAAHCLPEMPPCHTGMYLHEKTYSNLVGPLGEKPSLTVECLFADPISDLAVLGGPNDQELYKQCEAYEEFVESLTPFVIADAEKEGQAWLLSLDNQWFSARYERINLRPLWVKPSQPIFAACPGLPF